MRCERESGPKMQPTRRRYANSFGQQSKGKLTFLQQGSDAEQSEVRSQSSDTCRADTHAGQFAETSDA